MQTVSIQALASHHAQWLELRQASVSNNVANAHVPGYLATDTTSFRDVLSNADATLRATDARHFGTSSTQNSPGTINTTQERVSLETELVRAAEVKGAMELNANIVASFHRMFIMTAKV